MPLDTETLTPIRSRPPRTDGLRPLLVGFLATMITASIAAMLL